MGQQRDTFISIQLIYLIFKGFIGQKPADTNFAQVKYYFFLNLQG